MAGPASQENSVAQSLDTLYGSDGTGRLKLGIGDDVGAGVTPHLTSQGVGTHVIDAPLVTGDRAVLAGVYDLDSGNVVPLRAGRGTLTDCSGTITAGTVSQELAAALATRAYFFIQNLDAAENLWIDFTTAAVQDQPSIKLVPGAAFVMEGSFVSTEAINVIATTTSHKFAAKEA